MKKTYLAKRRIFFFLERFSIGSWAVLFSVSVLFFRLLAPNFFWHVFTPVFQMSDILASKSHFFISSFRNAGELAIENERLVQENSVLANENEILIQKTTHSPTSSNGILAGVVSRPPESPYDTLVLSSGRNQGVILGMEAFALGNVPLGTVSSVSDDFSRVTLFSAPKIATAGWVGSAALPVTLYGNGAGTIIATVARSANVSIGDIIFAPGPGMMPVGKIVRIDSNSSSPSVTLRVSLAINLFSLSWVELRDTGMKTFMTATSTLP